MRDDSESKTRFFQVTLQMDQQIEQSGNITLTEHIPRMQ